MYIVQNITAFFLLVLQLAINVKGRPVQTKLDLCVDHILEPFKLFSENLESYYNLDAFRTNISHKVSTEEEFFKPKGRILREGDQWRPPYLDPNFTPKFPLDPLSRRTICFNQGFPVNTTVWTYTCNRLAVPKEEYLRLKMFQNCIEKQSEAEVCYCPIGYYGPQCKEVNPVSCSIKRAETPDKCEGTDSYEYSYSLGGFDPCFKVDIRQDFELVFRVDCRFSYPELAYEGVKRTDIVFKPVNLNTSNFTYAIDNGKIKMLQARYVPLTVKFLAWDGFFNPPTFTRRLEIPEFEGERDVSIPIKATELKRSLVAGRVYYTASIDDQIVETSLHYGVVDDINYVEPKKSAPLSWTEFVIFAFLALIAVAIILKCASVGLKSLKARFQRNSGYEMMQLYTVCFFLFEFVFGSQ